jgi:acyl-CoA synthetase (AMP-forming)/AMP-acid ligase II
MTQDYARFGLTISEASRRAAHRAPDRVIYRQGALRLTLGELDQQASQLANALLARGFARGERAAVLMPARPECLVALVGVARAGGVSEFLMPQYGAAELPRMLRAAPPRWLLFSHSHRDEAEAILAEYSPRALAVEAADWTSLLTAAPAEAPALAVAPEDDAVILFTSGTTGQPKAIRRSHNSVMTHGALYNQCLGLSPESIMGGMLLSYESLAQLLADGGCMVLADLTQPREWLGTIERERITHIGGVTSLLQLWLTYPGWAEFDLRSVRSVAIGAMSTPEEVHALVRARFGLPITQMYGSIEAGLLAVNEATAGPQLAALGRPVAGKELQIVGEDGGPVEMGATGELVARPTGPLELGFMRGYCGEVEAPWSGGWLPTGDLAYQDGEGYLYLVGRIYETINVAGHKVYAPEVERVLAHHPTVVEAAVIGVPDELRGEIVVAHVVVRPGQQLSRAELHEYCAAHLALHKVPKRFIFRDQLPRTATGKIDKLSLSEQPEPADASI